MYDTKRKNYLAPISHLLSHFIYEYDIRKANLNILYYKGIIDKAKYDIINSYSRMDRQVLIGIMQKDPVVSQALSDGLSEFRSKFIQVNNIEDKSILSVKNDAFYLIDKVPRTTVFDNIEFVLKNTYSSYFHINKLEIYYLLDKVSNKENIDIKGIDDNKLNLHMPFLGFLMDIFESIESDTLENTIERIMEFYNKYINRQLPIEYYRELNSDSCYRVTASNNSQHYLIQSLPQSNVSSINIVNNLNIIRELYSIVSNLYFQKLDIKFK